MERAGDIWARVEVARPLPVDIPLDRVTAMTPVLHRLLTIDATPFLTAKGPLAPSPIGSPGWSTAAVSSVTPDAKGSSVSEHAASWPGTSSSTGTAWASLRASKPSGHERHAKRFSVTDHAHNDFT